MKIPEDYRGKFREMKMVGLDQPKIYSLGLALLYTSAGRKTFNRENEVRFFNYYSLSQLCSGEGIFSVPGSAPIPVQAGDAILIAPGFLHYYGQKDERSFFEEDNICFYGELPDYLFAEGYLKNGIFRLGRFRELLPVHELLQSGKPLDRIKGALAFQQLLLGLAEAGSAPARMSMRTPIEQLLYAIWQNPAKWWTVGAMAEFCNLEPDRFRREFQGHTGMLPKSYIDRFKVDLAKNWLLKFDWTLERIAKNLGYLDKFHFSRRFKALTGVSPDLFRRGAGRAAE